MSNDYNDGPMPFPLFKGATRLPTTGGVPTMPLMLAFSVVAALAMLVSMWIWLTFAPIWFCMAQITKTDDRAFRIWGLWFETKYRNKSPFWSASSYSKSEFRMRRKRHR